MIPISLIQPKAKAQGQEEEDAMVVEEEEEEEEEKVVDPLEMKGLGRTTNLIICPNKTVKALLDTGCLVGDCISRRMIDSLHGSHLLRDLDTTIRSGFNNQCHDKFRCLKINISFLNETNFLRKFLTQQS
jgi:hypothetical protein